MSPASGRPRPLVSGNWKMHQNHFEAIRTVQRLAALLTEDLARQVELSVHPPFTDLRSIQTILDADDVPIALGAQHCHHETRGAFTGEISPEMLAKLHVAYVIAGHSERRRIFGETDAMVEAKVRAIVAAGMSVILCVGETLEEREAGQAFERVRDQLKAGLAGVHPDAAAKVVVAYEPVWAIGTGRNASPSDVEEMVGGIHRALDGAFGGEGASAVRVQYGGSVTPDNARELLAVAGVDGALVGGASLEPESFLAIAAAARR